MFPDDATTEQWLTSRSGTNGDATGRGLLRQGGNENRWPNGIVRIRYDRITSRSEPFTRRCPTATTTARKYFSVKHGTAMQSSKIGYQDWIIAIYPYDRP